MDNTASRAEFEINGSATVAGAFICSAASGASGSLYGAADFSTSRGVEDGDTLLVAATLTAAAA